MNEASKKNYEIESVFNYNRYERDFGVGDIVKIAITDLDGNNGESFWVKITKATGAVKEIVKDGKIVRNRATNTRFEGIVDNDLLGKSYPKRGDIITFNIGHVINVVN